VPPCLSSRPRRDATTQRGEFEAILRRAGHRFFHFMKIKIETYIKKRLWKPSISKNNIRGERRRENPTDQSPNPTAGTFGGGTSVREGTLRPTLNRWPRRVEVQEKDYKKNNMRTDI
jgi:hypothetical protein